MELKISFLTLRGNHNNLLVIFMGNIMLMFLNNEITYQKIPCYAALLCPQLEILGWFILLQ